MQQFNIRVMLPVCVFLLFQTGLSRSSECNPDSHYPCVDDEHGFQEKYNSGWAFYIDNDVFSGQEGDRDYTGGLAVTLSGQRAQEFALSIDSWRNAVDGWFGVNKLYDKQQHFKLHSFEYGFTLFTPGDITNPDPIPDDRPYASLFFISNAEQTIVPSRNLAYQSTLTIGILGLPIAEDIQASLHNLTGSAEPQGWEHQISYGGEPTVKFSLSVQKTLVINNGKIDYELKTSAEGNIGYNTDIGIGIGGRWGRINTPWWSFNPHQAEYINLGSPVVATVRDHVGRELYLWAGANLKYSFYNALLQGQFRDSTVTFDRDQLEHVIAEGWIGVTREFSNEFRGSLYVRARSEEYKGPNARNPVWGGIIVSRAF